MYYNLCILLYLDPANKINKFETKLKEITIIIVNVANWLQASCFVQDIKLNILYLYRQNHNNEKQHSLWKAFCDNGNQHSRPIATD